MGILLAIHVLVTIFLILIVLIQKNEGGSSLFASSGGTGGMFNARGTSNIITKATWFLATLFLANCVLMATLDSSRMTESQTLLDKKAEKTAPAAPIHPANVKKSEKSAPVSSKSAKQDVASKSAKKSVEPKKAEVKKVDAKKSDNNSPEKKKQA